MLYLYYTDSLKHKNYIKIILNLLQISFQKPEIHLDLFEIFGDRWLMT
jgi:hypothetical protein